MSGVVSLLTFHHISPQPHSQCLCPAQLQISLLNNDSEQKERQPFICICLTTISRKRLNRLIQLKEVLIVIPLRHLQVLVYIYKTKTANHKQHSAKSQCHPSFLFHWPSYVFSLCFQRTKLS